MLPFDPSFATVEAFREAGRAPRFDELRRVMSRQRPSRPTLFEFALNREIYGALTAGRSYDSADPFRLFAQLADAYRIAGYDYVIAQGSSFAFPSNRLQRPGQRTLSLNAGAAITDRKSFERYAWPDPDSFDYSLLEHAAHLLPEGMRVLIIDSNGILEQIVELVGFDTLCTLLVDDPELVREISDHVGSRHLRYHQICAGFDCVGAHFLGDDWGFRTQTLISPADLRRYVLPWHRREVEALHQAGKLAVLHSCGQIDAVMEDVIDDLHYDAKHSFEDAILPVEKAYRRYGSRISILGGLDVDFLCRSAPKQVYDRAVSLMELTGGVGYALGSGNSIPDYVPLVSFLAMNAAVVFNENW